MDGMHVHATLEVSTALHMQGSLIGAQMRMHVPSSLVTRSSALANTPRRAVLPLAWEYMQSAISGP